MEQAMVLLKQTGFFGMIVPVSLVSGDGYQNIASLCANHSNWLSSYSNRPGKLFDGVEQRLTICLLKNDSKKIIIPQAINIGIQLNEIFCWKKFLITIRSKSQVAS
jgi:hypothetical protein